MPKSAFLRLSLPDSSRFNLNIVRGRMETRMELPDAAELEQQIRALEADIAILRAPAGSHLHKVLSDLPWPTLHADTLVYYKKQLMPGDQSDRSQSNRSDVPTDWRVALAQIEDMGHIADVTRSSFSAYRSHYHANPLLQPRLILEGYAEWAIEYLSDRANNRFTFALKDQQRLLAFLTCRIDPEIKTCEVILNAVHPSVSGRGIYSYLFAESLRSLARLGMEHVEISTQVWNYAAQKVWTRQGLILNRAYDTYHVNAMLSKKCELT